MLRVKDVPAVIDQLELWNKLDGHMLSGRLDPTRIGMSGQNNILHEEIIHICPPHLTNLFFNPVYPVILSK